MFASRHYPVGQMRPEKTPASKKLPALHALLGASTRRRCPSPGSPPNGATNGERRPLLSRGTPPPIQSCTVPGVARIWLFTVLALGTHSGDEKTNEFIKWNKIRYHYQNVCIPALPGRPNAARKDTRLEKAAHSARAAGGFHSAPVPSPGSPPYAIPRPPLRPTHSDESGSQQMARQMARSLPAGTIRGRTRSPALHRPQPPSPLPSRPAGDSPQSVGASRPTPASRCAISRSPQGTPRDAALPPASTSNPVTAQSSTSPPINSSSSLSMSPLSSSSSSSDPAPSSSFASPLRSVSDGISGSHVGSQVARFFPLANLASVRVVSTRAAKSLIQLCLFECVRDHSLGLRLRNAGYRHCDCSFLPQPLAMLVRQWEPPPFLFEEAYLLCPATASCPRLRPLNP
ncbi:hypothetical protein B0H14DRAFT_3531446 [Mycena olivaceomarginata]|nr:hypothetical protein B0H14DRAFT_3531446 [Mycena olivaceomarginata]